MAGAPKGNNNATKGRPWREAIDRAIKRNRDALDACAASLLAAAMNGDMQALKELGDRLDGKPAQSLALTDPDGGPLRIIASSTDENL